MESPKSESNPRKWTAWIILASLLLTVPYLTTLYAPFDFADDGALIYPPSQAGPLWSDVWSTTVDEYHRAGPFRPVSWLYWHGSAVLFGPNLVPHRLLRLSFAWLSALMLLWFFTEVGIRRWAALLAAAVSMWSVFRNEIWQTIGLSEAIAMPFVFLGLVAAVKAPRSARPWMWDIAGWFALLAALGVKNTFAAVVPVQMWLRLTGAYLPIGEGWRCHGRRALLLGTTLIFPVAHILAFKLDGQPRQYTTAPITLEHAWNWLRAIVGASSLVYLAAGLSILVGALVWTRRRSTEVADIPSLAEGRAPLHLLGAAALFVICGVAMYLPVPGIAGRYTIPAVWGVDLAIAVLLHQALATPPTALKKVGQLAFAMGMAGVLVATLGRTAKLEARAKLLWQAVEFVEANEPSGAKTAWVGKSFPARDELGIGEGVHFGWHLEHRGRNPLTVVCVEDATAAAGAVLAVSASNVAPGPSWTLRHAFHSPYWFGRHDFHCFLWEKTRESFD